MSNPCAEYEIKPGQFMYIGKLKIENEGKGEENYIIRETECGHLEISIEKDYAIDGAAIP